MSITAELHGGPHDGQQMTVPSHVLHVRVPVPGSTSVTHTPFDRSTKPTSSFWAATYERRGQRGDLVLYGYIGQEQVTG